MLSNKWFYNVAELVHGGENDNCDGYISGPCSLSGPLRWTAQDLISANCFFQFIAKSLIGFFCWVEIFLLSIFSKNSVRGLSEQRFRFFLAKRLFTDLSAWQTRWVSRSKSRSLIKYWQHLWESFHYSSLPSLKVSEESLAWSRCHESASVD